MAAMRAQSQPFKPFGTALGSHHSVALVAMAEWGGERPFAATPANHRIPQKNDCAVTS